MERNKEEMEIDLLELLYYLKKKVIVIVAVCLVCAVAGFVGTKLFVALEYTTNTRMYVLNRSNENNVVASDFQVAAYVMNDYKALITGQNVTKEVISRLGLDMKPSALSAKIQVTSPENTRVLQINITDTNPQMAADIANTVREVASAQIKQIMDVSAVQTVYEAEVPQEPSSPNAMRNTVLAATLGLVAVIGIYAVIYILDETIRTEEDVTRYLGLGTLGVIPMSTEMSVLDASRASKKHSSKRASARSAQ
ncbi:MAG: hypothetical protein IKY18_05510 [Oscillospiraceae bacterium]|nr:hypothetical protein [Oscillospiraceae bacterium]